jgi:hypothetical protein
MTNRTSPWILTRLQFLGLAILIGASGLALSYEILRSDAPFLTRGSGANWIGYPFHPTTEAIPSNRSETPAFVFTKRFRVSEEDLRGDVVLTARGLRSLDLSLNGATLLWDPPLESWKDEIVISLADKLQVGGNEVRARVRNATGPALLQLEIRGDETLAVTNASWEVRSTHAPSTHATLARDTQLLPESLTLPTAGRLIGDKAPILFLLFVAFALLHGAMTRPQLRGLGRRMPEITLAFATFYWLAVFYFKTSQLPVMMGFDIPAHLAFIDHLLEFGSLPLPDAGWSTYHPPLYHVLTAGLVHLTDTVRESPSGQVVYRIIGFLAGIATVWTTYFCARLYFDRDPVRTSLAVGFAALLPMNLYVSAYVSNESLHATFVGLATLAGYLGLRAKKTQLRHALWVGVGLGLAVLTKFTGLVLVPVFAIVMAIKIALLERVAKGSVILRAVAMGSTTVVVAAGIAGWFYWRNYRIYGDFIVWNVNLPGETTWWQQPGFHTSGYYLGFGESLRHPFFSGFYSFWDGIYSTFWGDGLVAGMVLASTRHPFWNYDFMTIGYYVALPVSILIALGFARTLERAFRAECPNDRIAYSFMVAILYVLSFSLLLVTFRLPYYAQAKAFYILAAMTPLSLIAATGLAEIPMRLGAKRFFFARNFYYALLGMGAGVIALSYLG